MKDLNFLADSFEDNQDVRKTVCDISRDKEKILNLDSDLSCDFAGMIGKSKIMQALFSTIEKISKSDSTVLITGESGTGKELVAQALYKLSERKNGPFVCVNCGAIPRELLESELFGHVKGAFTGAISNRKGRFELAHGGILFLDEIGELPLDLQVKLLRVLQTKKITPIGGTYSYDINTKIIAATNKNLEECILQGSFREDLYYRLNVLPIHVPNLQERKEDIQYLINYFLQKRNLENYQIQFDEESLSILTDYSWPGNVRELENLMERLLILNPNTIITLKDLPSKFFKKFKKSYCFDLPKDGIDLKQTLFEIEESLIEQALNRTKGNKMQAAKLLQINRTTLIEKMKKNEAKNASKRFKELKLEFESEEFLSH